MQMTQQTPTDLIPVADAEELVGHSRSWLRNHVQVYRLGRADYVSRSAVLAAKKEYDTPRPKGDDEK